MRSFLLFSLSFLFCAGSAAAPKAVPSGYVSNVSAEKSLRFYEVYLFVPQSTKEKSLQELIFSPLTKEFKEKYREKFGDLDTESIVYRSSAMGGTTEAPFVLEQKEEERQKFAEYMTKRLLEFHVDNYMKTQPQMKPVMEMKEKIQNVKVEVTKEVKVNIQYNFAGNSADVILDNPYCESKLSLEMDSSAFGPTDVQETRIWVSKDLNSALKTNSNLALTDGIAYADLTRSFPKQSIAASLGLSSAFKEGGTSPREVRYILGFSHTF